MTITYCLINICHSAVGLKVNDLPIKDAQIILKFFAGHITAQDFVYR